jgi:hypothetical protein
MKIGVTLDMSIAFWANGMQQNIVFLYDLFKRIGHECYYITKDIPKNKMHLKHKGMLFQDLIADKNEKLDILIIAGYDIPLEAYEELKKRNPNLKIIMAHFGHKLYIDTYNVLFDERYKDYNIQLNPKNTNHYIDQIWILPHHSSGIEYIKTYYGINNVIITPMIWEPSFVQDKIKELNRKNLSPFFKPDYVNKVCIFEPNINAIKTCFVPLMICERLESEKPGTLNSINTFCAEKIRNRKYFENFVKRLNILSKEDFCFFNNRWGSLDALSKFGSTIISHQNDNEFNYANFEQLYMGLPLIHNCPSLCDVGYYYEQHDIKMGANQLYNAILNHEKTLDEYTKQARAYLKQFSPFENKNINIYSKLIDEIK